MEFWNGRERHASQYAKYRTIPGWNSSSHIYTNKTPAPHCPESRSECQGWMGEPSSWTIPGSRTGGSVKDYVNWTDMIPSSNYSADNQHCPRELDLYASQGRSFEIQRALSERYREKEKLLQRGELTNKWQSCSSTPRREKEKLSANSYRELEAWANRYYHSLPRQKHHEAGTWSASQCIPDRERRSGSASRLVSLDPNHRPLANISAPHNQEISNFDNRLKIQETWKTQQPPHYITAKQDILWKPSHSNSKQRTVLSPSFSQPPNYIPPPPYSTSEVSETEKCITKVKAETMMDPRTGNRSHNSMFSSLRRAQHSLVPLTEDRRHRDQSSNYEILRTMPCLDTEKTRQQQTLSTLREPLPVQQPIQEHDSLPSPLQSLLQQFPEKSQVSCSDIKHVKPNTLKKRRGGETVFCLVSRKGELAGLSSSPDEPLKSHALPLLKVLTSGSTAAISEQDNSCERQREDQEQVQFADEVDSGGTAKLQHGSLTSMKVENIPEGHMRESQTHTDDQTNQEAAHKEELQGHIQERLLAQHTGKRNVFDLSSKKEKDPNAGVSNKEDENIDSCTSSKTASFHITESLEVPQSQTTVKFPLWKEPKWHYSSSGALEKNKQSSNGSQCEQEVDGQPKKSEINNNAIRDKNRGLVVIDATCVVVKVEFIFPPEKEHVQYVCSRSSDSYEHASQSLNLHVQNNDHNYTDPRIPGPKKKCPLINNAQEIHVQIQEQHYNDLMNKSTSDTVTEDTSQMSKDKVPDKLVSESETLKERAERILGITLQNSNNEEQTHDKLAWISQNDESNVQTIQGSFSRGPEESSEADQVDSESQLKGEATSENAKTTTEEIVTTLNKKEAHTLMVNADSIVEASEASLIDALKTVEAYETLTVVNKEENEDTSETDKAILDEIFTPEKTTVNVDTVSPTAEQLKDNSDGQVNDSQSDELNDMNNLLAPLLERYMENTNESFDDEDTTPLSDKRDMSVCSAVLGKYREEISELFDQESTHRDDIENLCPTLLSTSMEESGESFHEDVCSKEGNLPYETDDINNLCPTLLDDLNEDLDSSETFERDNLSVDMQTFCSTLLEDYVQNTSEYFGQESSTNEGRSLCETDDLSNFCPVLPSSFTEISEESFGQEELSSEDKPSNTLDDVNNRCPLLLESYSENTNELFGQEDTLNLSNEGDEENICSTVLVENTCELFGQECTQTEDIQNMCLNLFCTSVEKTSSQEVNCRQDIPTPDDVNTPFPCLLEDNVQNTCEPCGNDDVPMEDSLSHEADGIDNLCSTFVNTCMENISQLFGQEGSYRDANISDKTDDVCPSLLGSYVENTELFDQESKPSEEFPASATGDVQTLSPMLGTNVENAEESSGQEGNEVNSPLTHVHTDSKTISLESPLPCLPESPHHLELNSLAPSLLTCPAHQLELPSPPSSDVHIDQQSPSPSAVLSDSVLPSPPLTPVLLAHLRPSESSSQISTIPGNVCSNSSTPPRCIKKKHYPKSLWDAVNRIRKHTAPDSENEEEEGAEFWEQMENTSVEAEPQESVLEERLAYENDPTDVFIGDITDESIPSEGKFDEGVLAAKLLVEKAEELIVERKELDQTEEDTLSSSSLDSQDSKDTVIEGNENLRN